MIVVKFGGKTLNDEHKREKACSIIKDLAKKDKVVVIVSALGRYPEPYSTDTLARLVSPNIAKKDQDLLLSCGEIIACCVWGDYLNNNDVSCCIFSVYDLLLTYQDHKLSLSLDRLLCGFNNHDVVVIPGFIALDGLVVKTLPRGGSNLTACYIASLLKCPLYIYSDDYIYSKKIEDGGVFCPRLSYEQLASVSEKAPTMFPYPAIDYLKSGKVLVVVKTLYSDTKCSMIGDFE